MSEDPNHGILTPHPKRSRRAWAQSPWTLAFAYGLWALAGIFGIHNFYLRRPLYGGLQLGPCLLAMLLFGLDLIMGAGLVFSMLAISLAWDLLTIPRALQRHL